MTDHTLAFEELAAGYALDALEPADVESFERHLAGCPDCAAALREFREVAGLLAETAPDVEAPSSLGERIRAAATEVVPLRSRRRIPTAARWAAVAAAVVVLAGGVTSAFVVGGSSGSSCAGSAGCQWVALRGPDHAETVDVQVQGDTLTVVPKRLSPSRSGYTYVLWQLTSQESPTPVGRFDAGARAQTVGHVVRPAEQNLGFAVSQEPAGPLPTTPSTVVAVGAVTA